MSAVGQNGRNGWMEEPDCQACHQNGQRYTEAVIDTAGTLRAALDTTFATNDNTPAPGSNLYRFSSGHGDMQCAACHGSTHAIYPSSHAEDNLQSIGVQGHSGTVSECTACHTTTPSTSTGGPHGMHTVGQAWVKGHQDVAENNNSPVPNATVPTIEAASFPKPSAHAVSQRRREPKTLPPARRSAVTTATTVQTEIDLRSGIPAAVKSLSFTLNTKLLYRSH
jgi:hypothetical protein